ncbi:DEAD/DEAH box helicase family protein [Nostoc sp.]|uniref:DEAD/DEAH box helicase family protein n=1 Tax=Nostoc sp. TaxID=1180 RepID=UPI002FF84BC6
MVKESRFLRSKRLRASLWYAADGKCQLCGCDMPSNWHADHIVRWAETHRTNVHEMQGLCPQCHYTKTAQENRKMTTAKQLNLFSEPSHQQLNLSQQINLRKHQAEFLEICKLIKAGQPIKKILMLVTPGGGKSLIPVIGAAQLIPNQPFQRGLYGSIADAICWIVPKLNLQKQGEENFDDAFFKQHLAHQHRVMANNNEPNPCKGMSGYVATYQAIAANPDLHAQEFRRKRYILVLDEFHHVKEGGVWHRFLQPLVDQAVLLILVTGTHVRGDCQQIAFMPYKQTPAGVTPNLSNTENTIVLEYTRSQALRERAIVPLHFEWGDGEAEWIDETGQILETCNLRLEQKEIINIENFPRESLTPSEELNIMREKIENYVRRYGIKNGKEPKLLNGEIFNYFGKYRKEMALEELRKVWAWLQKNYPVTD